MAFIELGRPPEVDPDDEPRAPKSDIDYSTDPGMTVFVAAEAADTLERVAKERGYDPLEVQPVTDGLVGVHFPDGYFNTLQPFDGLGGIRLYQHAGPKNRNGYYDQMTNEFIVGFRAVVRIEDLQGRSWQNGNYAQLGEKVRKARADKQTVPRTK